MTSPVFLIPDLLSVILDQVDCVERRPYWRPEEKTKRPRSLLQCQRVNSLWFSEASRIIWRASPAFRHLGEVKDGPRRQHYVKLIRECTLNYYNIPGAFEFTRLETVRILSDSSVDDVHSLLMPTVEHFQFASYLEFNAFENLERKCPNMQSLCLQLGRLPSPELLESIKRYLAVTIARRVELRVFSEATEKLLPVLARNDNVRELVNVRVSQDAILHVMQNGIKQPFKHLKYFSGIDDGIELRDLLCIMPNVEYLVIDELDFYSQDKPALNFNTVLELASANLKRISMCTGRCKAEKSRLLELAKRFPLLESLRLHSNMRGSSDHDASELLDNEFAREFTRLLPNLKVIELEFDHQSLTAEGLISIGRNCPLLEVLNLAPCDRYPGWRRKKWRRSLFNCPIFSAEKEPLFTRLVYFAPLERMKHLPRWIHKYHFPIIFGELERKFGMASSDPDACRDWFAEIRTRLLAK